MPIYGPDLSYEDMRKAEGTFKCAQCGNSLTTAWSAEKRSYMLRCGTNLEHEGIVLIGRDPELLEIAHKLHGKELPMTTEGLKTQTMPAMLDRIDKARFPKDLTPRDCALIAKVCIEYGLDPLFGELMIYQGRPYVTIDARRRKAQETGNLDGVSARPATKDEREARRVPDEDYLFRAEVWVKGATHPFEGWGRVMVAETKADPHLPVVKDPASQAEKRAEAQALRRAFHLPLPSAEEIVEGEWAEVPPAEEEPKPKASQKKPAPTPAPATNHRPATEAQIKKIWADSKQMGYATSDIHAIIKTKWGVEHVTDLSVSQASELIGMIGRGEGIPAPEK